MTPVALHRVAVHGKMSVDPNVSLSPQFATFHYGNDEAGQRSCDELRKEFNAALKRQRYDAGRFECHSMTSEQLEKIQPTQPMF